MADPKAQEAAVKERIVNHMNKDHADSVRRYLEAFKKKSFLQVRNARLTDVTLNDMKFTCGGEQMIVPFDPPMQALREARERLVQLDKDALQILGRSDITITSYLPPWAPGLEFTHILNFTACLLTWIAFSRKANFQPGSYLHDSLLSSLPRFNGFCLAIQPILFPSMFVIHAVETFFMAKKLNRHGVTPLDGIWYAWILSTFNEGWTSFLRANSLIQQRQQEKEAKKH